MRFVGTATDGSQYELTQGTHVNPAALRCPLCGAENNCGIALGQTTCWCFSTPVPPEVVARIPAEQRNQVCVCRQCAESTGSATTETAAQEPQSLSPGAKPPAQDL
jgi:hypothetical protein